MILSSLLLYLGACVMLYACLMASSLVSSTVLHTFLVTLSHVIPILLCLLLAKRQKENASIKPLRMSRRIARLTLFSFPFVFGAVLLSALAASALTSLTQSGAEAAPTALTWYTFLRHACLTAVLEELFFRLLPMRLLGEKQRAMALVVSVITFAIFHAGQFRFLYAIVAGTLFFVVDTLTESLLPSIGMHIGVNTLSLLYTAIAGLPYAIPIFFSVAGALFIASAIWLFFHRCDIKNALKSKFNFT